MASLLTGKLTNINAHPSLPLATPQCWKTLPWHFTLKYTFTYSNSIHLDVQRHTYCLIRPPAEAPHPHACSFADNTAIRDAFKIRGSYKRAHGLLIFAPFTDNSNVQLYCTIQFSKSAKSWLSRVLGHPDKDRSFLSGINVMWQSSSIIS